MDATARRRCAWLVVLLSGCTVRGVVGSNVTAEEGDGAGENSGGDQATSSSTGSPGSSDEAPPFRYDVQPQFDLASTCVLPSAQQSCDARDDALDATLGINCGPGIGRIEGDVMFDGVPEALAIRHGRLGDSAYFAPPEGERMAVISTGVAAQALLRPEELARQLGCDPEQCPTTALMPDHLGVLPDPIDVRPVSDRRDCTDDPDLVGTGDCSNSLWRPWEAGDGAYDLAAIRMSLPVPPDIDGLAYDLAFFSIEYPFWQDREVSPWNDMYVAWLEGEAWTGNVSFDELGNPITINTVFLDFKDAPSSTCPEPCEAPELAGFAAQGHAGTKWLTTTAPVREGEIVELVLAVFDLTDGELDSFVATDGVRWTCSGGPPVTAPAG